MVQPGGLRRRCAGWHPTGSIEAPIRRARPTSIGRCTRAAAIGAKGGRRPAIGGCPLRASGQGRDVPRVGSDGPVRAVCFIGHLLMENRSALIVGTCLPSADGHAERIAALAMIEPRADRPKVISVGADKAYDAEDFVNELRSMNLRAHVAQSTRGRHSSIDRRTTRHAGYGMSQRTRRRIEEGFGWIKTVSGQRKTRFRGRDRVGWAFAFTAAAYNLVRRPKLLGALA